MTDAQALRSSEQFLGVQLDERRIDEIEKTIRKKCENIVLIGMPGCGKSTVGMALSKKLGRPFVDTDQLIEERIGQPLPDFFAAQGEEAFRRIETEVICEVGKRSGIILATGGGCVTRAENYEPLHQNGRIVWLMRDVNKLPTDGRPISQKNNLTALFLQRKEQYERFADCRVDQNGSVDGAVQALMEEFA